MTLSDWQLIGCLLAWFFLVRALYGRLVRSVNLGSPWRAAIMVWLTSPVLLALSVAFGENRSLADFTHLNSMPWSLIFGDVVILPLAAALAALAVRHSGRGFVVGPVAWWVCLMFGFGAGLAFHIWDAGNYAGLGLSALVLSASKIIHDLVIYPVLFGAFMFIHVLVYRAVGAMGIHRAVRNWRVLGYSACVVLWCLLVWRDATASLDPRDFHTACDVACAAGNVNQHLAWLHGPVDAVRSLLESWHLM